MNKKGRSAAFQRTRKQHGSETAEDYTELIADLIKEKGTARTCDLAESLGVSHVTALRTIRRLQEDGYVTTSHRKPVQLTEKGRRLARQSKKRHELLVEFFTALGVPEEQAEIDVEGVEHHISPVTLSCIKRFLNTSS